MATYRGVLAQLAEGREGLPVGPADLLHHQAQFGGQFIGLQDRHLHRGRALLLLVAVVPHRWARRKKGEPRGGGEGGGLETDKSSNEWFGKQTRGPWDDKRVSQLV